jgi:iron complex transport system permease protein
MAHYRHILRRRIMMLLLLLLIVASLLLDFVPSGMSLHTLWQTLTDPGSAAAGTRVIVWDIRMPYALMAMVVGLALGLAGAEMQTILNNPLASPFTLGVSSAAASARRWLSCWGLGFPAFPASGLPRPTRFCSPCWPPCCWTALPAGPRSPPPGHLFGIALVFTFNALVSMLQFVANETRLQGCSGPWAVSIAPHGKRWGFCLPSWRS